MEGVYALIEGINWIRLAVSLVFFFLFTIFNKWTSKMVFHLLQRLFTRKSDSIYKVLNGPVRAMMTLFGIYGAIYFYLGDSAVGLILYQKLVRTGFIISIGWALYNLTGRYSGFFTGLTSRLGVEESDMVIPFLSKVLRFVIIAITIAVILAEWGYNVNGLVAGLGLGSLAVALAAQDTLSNLIAGVIIVTEKPFSKGDWIRTDTVEGMVEDISFRSSKIRTFADSVIIVPNSVLGKAAITNWSRMGKRRVTFDLGLAIDTDRFKLNRTVERLRDYIATHEEIDTELFMVRFKGMTKDQLTIFFYFFTYTTVWTEHMKVLESINFDILRILEEEGVKLAVPAQRLFVENHAIFEKEAEASGMEAVLHSFEAGENGS